MTCALACGGGTQSTAPGSGGTSGTTAGGSGSGHGGATGAVGGASGAAGGGAGRGGSSSGTSGARGDAAGEAGEADQAGGSSGGVGGAGAGGAGGIDAGGTQSGAAGAGDECTPTTSECTDTSHARTCSASGTWLTAVACDPNATCTGSASSGKCTCQPGWAGSGLACAHVKRIFVTKTEYVGDLLSLVPGAASGLAAGDALCASSAQSAGLSGTYRAWLSTSKVNAIDRLADVGPWYVLNEYASPRYANKAAIVVTGPGQVTGIGTTEDGSTLSINDGGVIVWTGTAATGLNMNAAAPVTFCGDWASATDTGTYGFANRGTDDPSWTQYTALNPKCNTAMHLYCFEQ
jgi:hypothetical protein